MAAKRLSVVSSAIWRVAMDRLCHEPLTLSVWSERGGSARRDRDRRVTDQPSEGHFRKDPRAFTGFVRTR